MSKLSGIRNDENFIIDHSAHIHHGHFLKLFNPLAYDILHEMAQGRKTGNRRIVTFSDIDIKSRDVGSTGFQHPRTVNLRQGRHCPVYLFIDLDEQVIHVGTVVEDQFHHTCTVLGLTIHGGKRVDLDKLLTQRLQYAFVQFTCRHVRRRHLYCYIRDVHIRNERYRKKPDADYAEHDHYKHSHCHSNRPI